MKPIVRRSLGFLLIRACMILWSITLRMSRSTLRTRTCQGKGTLDVIVTNKRGRWIRDRSSDELNYREPWFCVLVKKTVN